MQFNNVFQYLFANKKGEIFQYHIFVPRSLLNIIKYKLHLIPIPYTKEEMEAAEQIILSGAMTTIDALIEIENKQRKEDKKETLALPKNKECIWQVTEENNYMVYRCVFHGVSVPIEEGKKPFHEIGILSPMQFVK
jgi:hypothetical protein